jgi:signal transduction histidine kinase
VLVAALLAAGAAVVILLVGVLLAFGLLSASPFILSADTLLILAAALVTAVAVAALVAWGASGWLSGAFINPVRRVTAAARRLSRGQYTERLVTQDGPPPPEDISELHAAFDELAVTLEAAERRRIESFGEVAHEIRTPVAVLEGYLEGLLDGHVKPSPQTWAMLHDEASRVHRLIDELQKLSRAEARQAPLDLQAVDPGSIAQSALNRLLLHFNEKGLEIVTEISERLPPVMADPDQALQTLVNLLTNALRYTPVPGRVTLSVGPLAQTNEVIFRVTDTGVGIAAEHIPHLFERFFRVDRLGNRMGGGSGIGLPVAKALVEAMGGRIWAESPGLGKGSTFSFTLLVSSMSKAD